VPVDDVTLQKITELSGGQAFHAGSLDELKHVYSTLQQQIGYETIQGDASAAWMRIGALVMALILFVVAVTLFLAREIDRRAQAEDKLEELATTDALTGLKNRRKFDTAIEGEWRRAARQRVPLALLMIDADHFKSYNDTFGHQAGDEVLIGIAICISDTVRRAGDCAARYGGEEFAVLLPGLSPEEALAVAETIRLKVQQWSGDPSATTVSIGVASLIPLTTMEWSEFVNLADKALYAAKAQGRNCSVLAHVPKLSLVA